MASEGEKVFGGELVCEEFKDFSYRLAQRARWMHRCSFFLIRERTNQESGPKGLIPFGNPQCEKDAALSLCLSFRKSLLLQRLCLQVKKTCKHGRYTQDAIAKTLATVQRTLWKHNFFAIRKAKALFFLTCRSCCLNLRHSTKSVYVISLVALCRAAMPGGSQGERLGSFSWLLLCWMTKK